MLNNEIIKAQTGLESLTEDQIKVVVELANNTIKSEVATEKGKLFGRFDADIEALTGIAKDGATPTHIYLKEAVAKKMSEKGQDPEIQKTIDTLAADNEKLKAQIKTGDSSGALKAELEKQTALVNQLRADQEKTVNEWKSKLEEKEQKYKGTLIDNKFNEALAGLKFKDEAIIPATVRDAFIGKVKAEITTKYKTQFDESGNLEFLDESGQIARNPENARFPFTAKELFAKSLESILDTGKQQSGGGSTGGKQKEVFSFGDAKTQVELDSLIANQVMSEGIARGTVQFAERHAAIRAEQNVKSLPVQ